jgi:hypothetical protein
MKNIKFCYLYRDGANYKQYGNVIFRGDESADLENLGALLNSKLIDGQWFYAHKWRVPDLHLYQWDEEFDHTFHEFECIEYTKEAPNTLLTLAKFKALVERTKL